MSMNSIIQIFYQVATGKKIYRNIMTPVGATIFIAFLSLIIFLSIKTDDFLGLPNIIDRRLAEILSIPFIVFGSFLVIWSVSCFIKAKGTPVPFNPPKDLVTTGPYARSRNPMITGVFVVLLGIGIYLCSYSLILFYLPAFIFFNYMELKKVEEPELEKRLGEKYFEYKNKTSMFLPWRLK